MNQAAVTAALAASRAGAALATDGILAAALGLSAAFPVIALRPLSKMPIPGLHGSDATRSEEVIRRWWGSEPWANVGLGLGHGYFVIDVDGDEGRDSLTRLPNPLPDTLTSVTFRGEHRFFHTDAFLRGWISTNIRHMFAPGIDLIGDYGWVPVSPSMLVRDGAAFGYRWDARMASVWGEDVPIAEAPGWLVDYICTRGLGLRMA